MHNSETDPRFAAGERGFARMPVVPRLRIVACVNTLYEHAGGDAALHRAEEIFYDKVLADPVLKAQFPRRVATHVDHLTWFTAESFGGPDRFTRQLGFQYIIDVHRHRKITDEQRQRFVGPLPRSGRRGRVADRRTVPGCGALPPRVRLARRTAKLLGRHRRRASPDPYRPPLELAGLSNAFLCPRDREPGVQTTCIGLPLIEIRRIRAVIPMSGQYGKTPDCG